MPIKKLEVRYVSGLILAVFLLSAIFTDAQTFRIADARVGPGTTFSFSYSSDTNFYYILQQGRSVTNITTPIALVLGTDGTSQLT